MTRRILLTSLVVAVGAGIASLPVNLQVKHQGSSRLTNIHISNAEMGGNEGLTITYGSCESTVAQDAHQIVAKVEPRSGTGPFRLVWVLPEEIESEGCISAWGSTGVLYGRSERQRLAERQIRRRGSIQMDNENGIDSWGPWFDGVNLLKNKEPGLIDVAAAKSKSVAVVGAGMSGLMAYLVLSQAGLTNVSIIESTQRLGGRVRTEYLSGGPFDYSYQEMGPMRFPATYTDLESNQTVNISDHQLVFSLAAEMNKLNGGDKNLSVDFIPWIQWNPNGLVYRKGFKLETGLPPTVAQISANSSLSPPPILDGDTENLLAAAGVFLSNSTFALEMANNMFKAHKEWLGKSRGLNVDERTACPSI